MSPSQTYDAIVIGSGLGGLTAGALMARDGARVLLLERHDRFGGAATIFSRPGVSVEVGLHELDGLDAQDSKRDLFDALGLRQRLTFVKAPELFAVNAAPLGEAPFVMPEGADAARAAVKARFPQHARGIDRWFKILDDIRGRLFTLSRGQDSRLFWLLNGPIFPLRFWPIIRWERATVGAVLEALFGADEGIKIALLANIGYYSDDPHQLSMLYLAAAQGSYHRGGGWYIKGGSQRLSDELARQIREAGGATLTKRPVQEILVEDGRAVGVVHTDRRGVDPQIAYAPILFGNAAPHLLREMLPEDQRAAFEAPWRERPLSTSLWSIYLGFDADPTALGMEHYSEFIYPSWLESLSQTRRAAALLAEAPGERLPPYVAVNYARIDSGLSGDQRLVVLTGVDQLSAWEGRAPKDYKAHKAAWLEALIEDMLRRWPRLRPHLVYKEMATAKTMQRYLRTPGGAVYGFGQQPEHAGRHRPAARTSIEGLYLASAFAQPGGGFTGAMLVGANAHRAASARKVKRQAA